MKFASAVFFLALCFVYALSSGQGEYDPMRAPETALSRVRKTARDCEGREFVWNTSARPYEYSVETRDKFGYSNAESFVVNAEGCYQALVFTEGASIGGIDVVGPVSE